MGKMKTVLLRTIIHQLVSTWKMKGEQKRQPDMRDLCRSVDGSLSTRRNSVPITQAALNIINRAADTVLLRSSGYFSSTESAASADEEKKPDSKVRVAPIQETVQVAISPTELSTDVVLARRHSETMPHPARITDQFSSF